MSKYSKILFANFVLNDRKSVLSLENVYSM